MKRLSSIFMLVLALVALSGPSLGMGLGLYGAPRHAHVTASSDDGAALVWTCKDLGGKRVAPCHPDLGVLLAPIAATLPDLTTRTLVSTAPLARGQSPNAELPPPRLG